MKTWPSSAIAPAADWRAPSSTIASLASWIARMHAFFPISRSLKKTLAEWMPAESPPWASASPSTIAKTSAASRSRSAAAFSLAACGDRSSLWWRSRSIMPSASVGWVVHDGAPMSHSFGPRWPCSAMSSSQSARKPAASSSPACASRSRRPSTPASNAAMSDGEPCTRRLMSHMRKLASADSTSPIAAISRTASSPRPIAAQIAWTAPGPSEAPRADWQYGTHAS